MQLSYKLLHHDEYGVECLLLKSPSANFFVYQAHDKEVKRVKRAYKGAKFFYHGAPHAILEPISYNLKNNLASALYNYVSAGNLNDFLSASPNYMHYAIGKKCGRTLYAMHQISLSSKQKMLASKHLDKIKDQFFTYLNKLPRMPNDGITIDAILSRLGNLKIKKPIMRYGAFKVENILLSDDFSVIFKPSATFGEGDPSEDFAYLSCENSDKYPCFIAGAIDGYFGMRIPTSFYLNFAMYCALNSLYRCAHKAQRDLKTKLRMQEQSLRIQKDFANFTIPIPCYLQSAEVQLARQQNSYLKFI